MVEDEPSVVVAVVVAGEEALSAGAFSVMGAMVVVDAVLLGVALFAM